MSTHNSITNQSIADEFLRMSEPSALRPKTFQERANILLRLGILVIPLQVKSKDPCTKHGALDGTTNPAIIDRWVEEYVTSSNCGACARFDGYWMLDDDRGTLAAKYKADTGQDLPFTLAVKTSRGFHYYFLHDAASRLIRYDDHDNSGVIDIPGYKGEARCNNQYVVSPGSVHPSGALYEIYKDAPIVSAPVQLLEWLQKAYALSESLKIKSKKPKSNRKADPGFNKLFDATGYRPLVKRINALPNAQLHLNHGLQRGKVVPCPMPHHKHADYSDCFGPMQDVPEVLHCLGNCQWSGDMVAAIYQLDGGKTKYKNMYDCARAICQEEKLNFEDFFRVKPEPQNTSTESQDANESPSTPGPRYPIEVWDGTLFQECANLCRSNNHIPPEFFIESLKTIIGAICGHRIVPVDNIGQESRYYTTIMSEHTGDGKSEAAKWMMNMMLATGLLYDSERPPLEIRNIGAYRDTFASGRGMVEAFFTHPRILQWYDELSIMVEKFGIVGSGASFMGLQTDMFESNLPPRSRIGGTKARPVDAPPTCHNSVLACTVKPKRDLMYASSGAENSGWFPRESLIVTGEVELVARLCVPNLTDVGKKLKDKILSLEHQCARVYYSAAAQQLMDKWFLDLRQRTKEESDDVWGRLNVLVQRNASMLAWLLAGHEPEECLDTDETDAFHSFANRQIEVTEDMMRRAILLAEYTLAVRRENQPLVSDNTWAKCENIIKKHLCQRARLSRKMLYRYATLSRFGIKIVNQSLLNLIQVKTICIRNKPDVEINGRVVPMSDEEALKLPTSTFQWMGDGRKKDQGWNETRGGDRKSPYFHSQTVFDCKTEVGQG